MLEAVPVQPDLPGWWYLFPEHHPASPTSPPASAHSFHLHSVNPMSSEPLVWATLRLLGFTSAPAELMHFPGKMCLLLQIILCYLCHGRCSLWEFPGQHQSCAS